MRGIEREPDAVAAYEFDRDVTAEPIGFVEHPTIPMCGASPDRSVGDDGLLEVKCPRVTTFLEVKLGWPNKADDGYLMQCSWQLACTGRKWNDLTYYCQEMPIGKQLYVRRIPRDENVIAAMETEARAFLAELAELEQQFAR